MEMFLKLESITVFEITSIFMGVKFITSFKTAKIKSKSSILYRSKNPRFYVSLGVFTVQFDEENIYEKDGIGANICPYSSA